MREEAGCVAGSGGSAARRGGVRASAGFDLTGKTALVTGAGRGLGQAMAIGLAQAGAKVAIGARRADTLAETAALIGQAGGRSHPVAMDVRDVDAVRAGIDAVAERWGRLDVLVNNAGHEEVCPSLDVSEAIWDDIVDTNLKGAFFCAQHAARHMDRAGGGAIVNICSLTSYVGVPTAVPYGSSKSGLLGMTRALASEWAAKKIRVNAIAPGYFRTAMTDVFYRDEDWRRAMLDKIPMRGFGDPDDLKGAVVFLASDAARYVTGQCLAVDGGYLASI